MKAAALCIATALFLGSVEASELGLIGGPEPANAGAVAEALRGDAYDLELLISYGTSKGGSAGHLALAIRGAAGDDIVHSANFYADRSPEHEKDRYTAALVTAVRKSEYLWGTSSSLGSGASFGLDFGEIYKRSVIGVRVYGVPESETRALGAFFERVNADYRARRADTDYHDGEVVYGYLDLNCAKTIGMGFRIGAGYDDVAVSRAPRLAVRKVKAAVKANIPTEMALKLAKAWNARRYRMDVVLYRKFEKSAYVDPREEEAVAFKDLPNRFPSVLSRDFRRDMGEYRDYDNLYAMHLLANMTRHVVALNAATGTLDIETRASSMGYPQASVLAAEQARSRRSPSLR